MNSIHSGAIAAIIFCAAALAAAGQDRSENLFYIINYTISHCNAEVNLNGVPITKTHKDTAYTASGTADIGRWLVPGDNVITVVLLPPEGTIDPDDRQSIEITVSTALRGQMSDEGTKIAGLRIPVKEGDVVEKGSTVIVISAMKMESEYKSPLDGVVKKIYVNEGDTINSHQPLVEIE